MPTAASLADTPVEQLISRDAAIGNELDNFEGWFPNSSFDRMSIPRQLLAERCEVRAELERRRAEQRAQICEASGLFGDATA